MHRHPKTRWRPFLFIAMVVTGCGTLGTATPSLAPTAATATGSPTPEPSASPSATAVASLDSVLPDDINRLGTVRLASQAEREGAISQAAAEEAAAEDGYDWPDASSYLVVVTSDATDAHDEAIVDRLAWLIRWDDLNIEFPAPLPADGTPLPHEPYKYGYVLVDGHTSQVMVATYMD